MVSEPVPLKLPPLMPRNRNFWLQWARKYITLDLIRVTFTDETRSTLDGLVGWGNCWVGFRAEFP